MSIKPFIVTMGIDSFGFFKHSKHATLWLKPLQNETGSTVSAWSQGGSSGACAESQSTGAENGFHPGVLKVHSKLIEIYPDFDSRSENGFQPHLSLGQFKKNVVTKFMDEFKEYWPDIAFEVKEIYMISRANFDDPFHIRHAIPLQG